MYLVGKIACETCVHAVLLCSDEMYSTRTQYCELHGRTDFKFKSLLYIIETKCVSEFEVLNVLGVENSM